MGRKIPAKKHRGVKDPLEQQARRLQVLKSKINAPPRDPDEQPVPRSLTQLFAFRDGDKAKPRLKSARLAPRGKPKNPIGALRKLPGESGRGFSLRINSAIKALHQSEEPHDYPQDWEEDDEKGQRMAEQRARRERKRKRGKAGAGDGERPPRAQRLALRKKERKLQALQEAEAERRAQPCYERVAFGDVPHAPPSLAQKGRAAARPGRRGLLLAGLLRGAGADAADLQRRERARLDAVQAYRALNANKHKSKTSR